MVIPADYLEPRWFAGTSLGATRSRSKALTEKTFRGVRITSPKMFKINVPNLITTQTHKCKKKKTANCS